jgi:hypothetical protein
MDDNLILDLEAVRVDAMVKRDIKKLDELLADDLSYTHSGGYADTKASFIAFIRDKGNYLAVDFVQRQVIPWGDSAAVVRGIAQISLEGKAPYQVFFVDVWARRNSKWQMVAWQATRAVDNPSR